MSMPNKMKPAPAVKKIAPVANQNLAGEPQSATCAVALWLIVPLALAVAVAVYLGVRLSAVSAQLAQVSAGLAELQQNPSSVTQRATAALVAQVGKLMALPSDEEPTVATVNNPERLKAQPFFARAKPGDKVLIYHRARQAILYDPVNNLIVAVAPVLLGNPSENLP